MQHLLISNSELYDLNCADGVSLSDVWHHNRMVRYLSKLKVAGLSPFKPYYDGNTKAVVPPLAFPSVLTHSRSLSDYLSPYLRKAHKILLLDEAVFPVIENVAELRAAVFPLSGEPVPVEFVLAPRLGWVASVARTVQLQDELRQLVVGFSQEAPEELAAIERAFNTRVMTTWQLRNDFEKCVSSCDLIVVGFYPQYRNNLCWFSSGLERILSVANPSTPVIAMRTVYNGPDAESIESSGQYFYNPYLYSFLNQVHGHRSFSQAPTKARYSPYYWHFDAFPEDGFLTEVISAKEFLSDYVDFAMRDLEEGTYGRVQCPACYATDDVAYRVPLASEKKAKREKVFDGYCSRCGMPCDLKFIDLEVAANRWTAIR